MTAFALDGYKKPFFRDWPEPSTIPDQVALAASSLSSFDSRLQSGALEASGDGADGRADV